MPAPSQSGHLISPTTSSRLITHRNALSVLPLPTSICFGRDLVILPLGISPFGDGGRIGQVQLYLSHDTWLPVARLGVSHVDQTLCLAEIRFDRRAELARESSAKQSR